MRKIIEASRPEVGPAEPQEITTGGTAVWPLFLALLGVAVHAAVLQRYGWFRDELYYVACARHLDLGYVDHPPLVAFLARLVLALAGPSLAALRLTSVLAGALVVLLAGWIARELGGGRLAQTVAALCALVAPVYLFAFHIFSMNSFDILWWTLAALVVARIARTGNGRLWPLFGLICGIGLETKLSMLFFGFGVTVGLVLTSAGRRHLREPWLWLGGVIAGTLALPHLVWQFTHGWPTVEFIHNATLYKNVPLSPLAFLREQMLQMNPLALPVWLAGLVWLLLSRRGRPFRLFGWAYLAILGVMLLQHAKAYYLAPVYPPLFAAGATALETGFLRLGPTLRSAATAFVLILLLAGGALIAPFVVPVLPVETFVRYERALGLEPRSDEGKSLGELPQHYADMHGWEEMVGEVARAVVTLPPEERARMSIFGQNYGEAGAIDLFGPKYGLPPASSGHNSYFLWGPAGTGDPIVVLGGDDKDNRAVCADLRQIGEIDCGRCMPYENHKPIWLCRGLHPPLAQLWPRLKHFE